MAKEARAPISGPARAVHAAPAARLARTIDPGLSLYLDLLRFLAAVSVVLHHVWELLVPSLPLPWPGHACVVLFFVLSGYVIAYTSDRPDVSLPVYSQHRLARMLSVTVPALLLAVAVAPLAAGPAIPNAGPLEFPLWTFIHSSLLNLFFLGQSFGFNNSPPFNPPYWSISYEVWYYVIFAAWRFSAGWWRYPVLALACALAGFKILVLMPVWLLGVVLYKTMPRLAARTALFWFLASAIAMAAFYWTDASRILRGQLEALYPAFMLSLRGSNQFVGDYLFGAMIAVHFATAASLGPYLNWLFKFAKPIRYLSGFTFSTYLYHMPLTVLIYNGLGVHSRGGFALLLVGGIGALGYFTERRVGTVRRLLERAFDKFRKTGVTPA